MAKKQKDFGNWTGKGWDLGGSKGSSGSHTSCYHSHPPLEFTDADGVVYAIYGGNCATPVVKDADIYVGLTGMQIGGGSNGYPWEPGYKQPVIVDYYIADMQTPMNAGSFKQMVEWLCNQLRSGKKIHVGCHGGHGRTGMVLVAVVASMTGMKDAIQYVRKHYCEKAVETTAQIKFLMNNYGVSTAGETKKFFIGNSTKPLTGTSWDNYPSANGYQGSSGSSTSSKPTPTGFANAVRKFGAVSPSKKAIW